MKLSWFAAAGLVVGCGGSVTEGSGSAPGPIEVADFPQSDVAILVIANSGAERLVFGNFDVGRTSGSECDLVEKFGGCSIRTCRTGADVRGTPVDPGAVKVTSPSIGTDVPIEVDAAGFGRIVQSGDFRANESVRIVGGGTPAVQAFDLSVKVPAGFAPLSFGNCGVVTGATEGALCKLTEAPVARWVAGEGIATLTLTYASTVADRPSLSCRFDATKGAGEVPAAALAKLPRGQYTVSVTPRSNFAGDAKVGVLASRYMSAVKLQSITLE